MHCVEVVDEKVPDVVAMGEPPRAGWVDQKTPNPAMEIARTTAAARIFPIIPVLNPERSQALIVLITKTEERPGSPVGEQPCQAPTRNERRLARVF